MAVTPSKVIIVAQAETGPAGEEVHVEDGVVLDETHAGEEHSDVFPPFDPATFGPQLVWLALTFVVLYVVLSRAALPRIAGILEQRRSRIEGDLKEAERLQQETERAVTAYEAALAEARKRAHGIAEETRTSIRADIEGKRAKVEADLNSRMTEAEARIRASKDAAMANVDTIATETAVALVEQLSGTATTEEARSAVLAAANRSPVR